MKLNNLDDLKREKLTVKLEGEKKLNILKNDLELIKNEFKPLAIFSRASTMMVPEEIRRSPLLNAPINFIARRLFKEDKDVVSPGSDNGKGNLMRNVALSLLETAGTYLLTRYMRRKL